MPEMDGLEAARTSASVGPRQTPPHHRHDRQRPAGRPRKMSRSRHGRLHLQTCPHWRTASRPRTLGSPANCKSRRLLPFSPHQCRYFPVENSVLDQSVSTICATCRPPMASACFLNSSTCISRTPGTHRPDQIRCQPARPTLFSMLTPSKA